MVPRTRLTLLLVALLAATALAGCVDRSLFVVASAPREANGLTIAVARAGPPALSEDRVRFEVRFNGETVFPPNQGVGVGNEISLEDGRGSAFVPYARLVHGNGDYEVRVHDGDAGDRTIVTVQKWVQYVYLKPYMREDRVVVDAILESSSGGHPSNRIIAEGELMLEFRYRGPDGSLNQSAHVLRTTTPPHETFTRVSFHPTEMDHYKGSGWYSVHAVFDNEQAVGNLWVRNDPVMDNRDPPQHWVYVD